MPPDGIVVLLNASNMYDVRILEYSENQNIIFDSIEDAIGETENNYGENADYALLIYKNGNLMSMQNIV